MEHVVISGEVKGKELGAVRRVIVDMDALQRESPCRQSIFVAEFCRRGRGVASSLNRSRHVW